MAIKPVDRKDSVPRFRYEIKEYRFKGYIFVTTSRRKEQMMCMATHANILGPRKEENREGKE